jgi:hypothetical protein
MTRHARPTLRTFAVRASGHRHGGGVRGGDVVHWAVINDD